ncbi:MAG: hypothetical protein U5N55_06875, partial [Cypionkella sp.]|nr:hypothetical protein [Cypionkella sp.]
MVVFGLDVEAASRAGLAEEAARLAFRRAQGMGQLAAGVSSARMLAALALGAAALALCLGANLWRGACDWPIAGGAGRAGAAADRGAVGGCFGRGPAIEQYVTGTKY